MHKVIFDTDPGVDDALALYYLHRHPQVELLAVTTVFGNAPVSLTTRNALFLNDSWGIDAPVAAGAAGPIGAGGTEHWPVHIHGHDGLGNIGVPAPARAPDPRPAHRLIIDMVRAFPGEVTIVAVARMTNLARALREAPEIAGMVKQVILMGGAFAVPGNITPAAEANIFGDAEAADEVFGAPWPVLAIGLDVTRQVEMTRAEIEALGAQSADLALLRDLSLDYVGFYEGLGHRGMVVHDCCACVALTDPGLFGTRAGRVRVLTTGLGIGMTVAAPEGMTFPPSDWDEAALQSWATAVDAEGVLARIRATIAP